MPRSRSAKFFRFDLGLAEVEVEQELDRPRAVERDEFAGAAVLRGDRKGDLLEIIVDELRLRPGFADVSAPGRLRSGDEDILGKARDEGRIVGLAERAGVTGRRQIGGRTLDVVDLGVVEQGSVEYRTTPVDHADQQASGISRKALEARDEGVMIRTKHGCVRPLHEPEHFGEVVEIIVDGQLRQFGQADLRGRNRLFYFCSKAALKSSASTGYG